MKKEDLYLLAPLMIDPRKMIAISEKQKAVRGSYRKELGELEKAYERYKEKVHENQSSIH